MHSSRHDPPPAAHDVAPAPFFAAFEAAARRAAAVVPVRERTLTLGGVRLRLALAGDALLAWLLPALAHALGPAGPAAATLTLWDGAATGVAPPPPTWGGAGWATRGELAPLCRDGFVAAYHEDAGYLAMLDRRRRHVVAWVRDAARVPRYERAAPLRGPLSWLVSEGGAQLAHAAAVATPDGAVLLAGPGGSGKSTTAALCLAAGLDYLGDDYVIVTAAGGGPEVHALYATAKLTEDALARLPAFAALVDGPGTADDKAMAHLAGAFPAARLPSSRPLRAVVLPAVSGALETRWTEARRALALQALAPTTLFQLPGAGRDAFQRLAAVAAALPAYRLSLGTRLDRVPDAIRAIIAAASQAAP